MTKIWPTPIKAIIFDNDGTLVDTEWAYSWAHKQITGEELSWDLKPQLMGKSSIETCVFLINHYHLDIKPEDLVVKRTDMLTDCWKKVELLPGADQITSEFHARGIPMSIATSSRRPVFEQKTENHQTLVHRMHHVVCGSEVKRGKPNPDIFQLCLQKFESEIKPEETLVFEDSPLGVKAANEAGMPCVFVPDPNMDVETSLSEAKAKATIIIKSLEDFDFNSFEWAK
ncbi:Pseudouridine-5'-monophosphatase [Tritrichomonas foetus]|uniref:Pseudouridine-5'-monophosphatase n=1 Tax=Tritrichomonas foetus TaxID=1144522 RepID=A0A1J4KIR4_9EUKA|nr:Pseudouridine-5'-monophosphatase [Tritrichomonas foetus]|eukprot:OHT09574.1 Pseudouridine-5'-monophosphatase [Tritrichomonas foetus]